MPDQDPRAEYPEVAGRAIRPFGTTGHAARHGGPATVAGVDDEPGLLELVGSVTEHGIQLVEDSGHLRGVGFEHPIER